MTADGESGDGGVAETTTACPECDSTYISRVIGREPDVEGGWRCRDCGTRFQEPVEREAAQGFWSPRSSAGPRALLDADPDVVPDGGAGGGR